MSKKPDYRLRIIETNGTNNKPQRTYIVRKDGDISYFSAGETPLALSNLLLSEAAETRFKLEDAPSGNDAALALRAVLKAMWINNKPLEPKVEVLP